MQTIGTQSESWKPAKISCNIIKHGKYLGYHVKESKCQLIVKDEKYNEAIKRFKKTEIEMKKGARVLGSVIGSEAECKTFLETQLEELNKILTKLGKITKTSPQNVYSCYTKGVHEKLSFLATTIPRKHAGLREDIAGKYHSKFNL